MGESLPNIKGSWNFNDRNEGSTNVTGAYRTNYASLSSYYIGVTGGVQNVTFGLTFDASRSSLTYQDNAPVRPLSITTAFLIRY